MDKEKAHKKSTEKDDYLVALKALIMDGNKLLITHDVFGHWDVPGGRIRKDQFDISDQEILQGKITEELGEKFRCEVGDITTTMRVEREEFGRSGELVRIYGVVYLATYLGGEVQLGDHHDKYEWIDFKNADLERYRSDAGWVHLLKDYQESLK